MRLFGQAAALLALSFLPLSGLFTTPLCSAEPGGHDAIPWGAMYAPLDAMKMLGMTGTFGYYRGARGVRQLLADLETARSSGIKLVVTLGDVRPSAYADQRGNIDMTKVKNELNPFVVAAEQLTPFIESGTMWGIRFMDEPHDPNGLPRGVTIDKGDLGIVMAYLKQALGKVRVGSTSPARYMVDVPNADWCFGQYCHRTAGRRGIEPVPYIREDAALAKRNGMSYIASLNASTNPVGNKDFFEVFKALAALPEVDFLTSWQWPQGDYPNSFEKRLADPAVKDLVEEVPRACVRERRQGTRSVR